MTEATWLIIIGLGFDILGAIFIIRPLLDKVSKPPNEKENQNEEEYDEDDKKKDETLYLTMNPFSHYRRNRQLAWIGLILLCIGFSLQIIGNWIQNPPLV